MSSLFQSQDNILHPAIIDMKESLLATDDSTRKTKQNENDAKQNSQILLHGTVIGFLAQLINISGTVIVTYRWGPYASLFSEHENVWDHVLHFLVLATSQVDLLLYIVMWFGLTAALTDRGVVFWNYMLGSAHSARFIFVMGVQFYAGVVVGSFLSWLTLDFALGLPASVYPMISVLVFGLMISYSLIWCFDLERKHKDGECEEVTQV